MGPDSRPEHELAADSALALTSSMDEPRFVVKVRYAVEQQESLQLKLEPLLGWNLQAQVHAVAGRHPEFQLVWRQEHAGCHEVHPNSGQLKANLMYTEQLTSC